MKIIAVDSDAYALKRLSKAIREVDVTCELQNFLTPAEALNYVSHETIDAAFLGIELGCIDGLTLAKRMKTFQQDLPIIFVTNYEQYALEAFGLHATGYLLKPVSVDAVRRELTFLHHREGYEQNKRVQIQTFGGFEIMVNGKPVHFKRAKAKELLACIVDRRGASITTGEACALLWEDHAGELSKRNYFRTIVKNLKEAMADAGCSEILLISHNSFAINPKLVNCDSYRFLEGDPIAVNSYRHDYMPCYSWAEFSVGQLESLP